jgi:hypothetical protein
MVARVRGCRVFAAALLGAGAGALAAGCGSARQDKGEPARTVSVKVLSASFPARQAIAKRATFELRVVNTSARTVPNIAVTLDSFSYVSHYAGLAANKRPVWVIEKGPGAIPSPPVESQAISPPGSGQTAYVNTWALGPLTPGSSQTFEWLVVPVKAGRYAVHYTVAAGLSGKAKARTASGGAVQGALTANIAPAPPLKHVDPKTGNVVSGQFPSAP